MAYHTKLDEKILPIMKDYINKVPKLDEKILPILEDYIYLIKFQNGMRRLFQ